MREDITTLFDEARLKLPRPKCIVYEPLSETEGTCYDNSIVNINGCNNPENCDRYKRIK
mgnify:CR=1 FL=1